MVHLLVPVGKTVTWLHSQQMRSNGQSDRLRGTQLPQVYESALYEASRVWVILTLLARRGRASEGVCSDCIEAEHDSKCFVNTASFGGNPVEEIQRQLESMEDVKPEDLAL